MPASRDELALHQRLIDGDETASGEVFARYLNWLTDLIEAKNPAIAAAEPTLIVDAVVDVLLDYCEQPRRYAPTGKSLRNYFCMAVCGDMLNRWRAPESQPRRMQRRRCRRNFPGSCRIWRPCAE